MTHEEVAIAVNAVARHGDHCIDPITDRIACGDPLGHEAADDPLFAAAPITVVTLADWDRP